MAKADGGASNSAPSRLTQSVTLDVQLRAAVFTSRPRILRDQLAVNRDRAEVHEPFERFGLKQPVDERAVARIGLPWNASRGLNRAVDDDIAVVEQMRLPFVRDQRADANVGVRRDGIAQRGAEGVANGGDDCEAGVAQVPQEI